MADEFQLGNGSWWDTSRNRLDGVTTPTASITTTLASFEWPTDMVDMKSRSSMDSGMVAPSGCSHQSSTGGGDGFLANQMVGLGLSSQSMDWNQALLGEKSESSFRSMLEEDMSSNTSNFQQDDFQANKFSPWLRGLARKPAHDQLSNIFIGYGANTLGRGSNLHFTNINNTFWNAYAPPAAMDDARSSFFPADKIPGVSCFDEKPKKNSTEQTSNKRPRNKTPSPLPAFKVRKEKMGDRITALQQLVSPFGKTDTASVLSEAIEHIKFLHEQVDALSSPYMKNGALIHHQQNSAKYKLETEGPRQDLRSRGLCLVPVSSTFPVTHETTVDFWTPKFAGSFR